MKKFLMMLGALVVCAASYAVEPTAVRVTTVGGEQMQFLFSDAPEVQFAGDKLQVTSLAAADPVTFDFDQVESIDFPTESAVTTLRKSDVTVRLTQAALEISNLPARSAVDVYSLDGRRVFHSDCEGECSVERRLLQKGLYVVKINKNSFKITL